MPRISEAQGVEGWAGVYLHCPNLFKGFLFNYGLVWSHSKLDPVLKDLVRLKSSNLNGCQY